VILLVLPATGSIWGVEQVAIAYFVVALCLLPIPFFILVRIIPVSGMALVQRLWRPLVAGAIMLLAVTTSHGENLDAPQLTLALDVALGAVVFVVANAVLWLLAGRPGGPERVIVARLASARPRSTAQTERP
jgi:hypothetical protein